jgi:hypothetical protein
LGGAAVLADVAAFVLAESGSGRMMMTRPPAAQFRYGVFAKHAALKDQPYRPLVNLFLAESPRARGAPT